MRFLVCAAAIAVAVGCNSPAFHFTPPDPNDYPCALRGPDGGIVNINGVECPDHMCCLEGDVCGGQVYSGCPADECCFVGDGYDYGAAPDGGTADGRASRRRYKKFPAHTLR